MHIESPELVSGSIADVIIIPETPAAPTVALASLIGAAAGGFTTLQEADAFIRQGRNTWQGQATLTERLYLDTNNLCTRWKATRPFNQS